MTQQEKIVKLATEVMGWKQTDDVQVIGAHHGRDIETTVFFLRDSGTIGVAGKQECDRWNPFQRWDHAGMLAEKLAGEINLARTDKKSWRCTITPYDVWIKRWPVGEGTTGPAAISEAALATIVDNCFRK